MAEKKLFLLDAYALIYRAYYALIRTPRFTTKGFNTSAIFGFCNTLDDVLNHENPTHIAVCFDPSGHDTFRHEAYPDYKATRDAQPEDITLSVPYIKRIIEAYRIPVFEVPRYEADDVIGTLAVRAEAEGYTTYMMTPDKDYGQLVTDRIFMYKPGLRGNDVEIRGPREVCEKYGISSPRQVIDLLALEGDSIDNIPGCPGVGEKTAVKLIGEFGSVENLLANTDRLKGALQRKVTENAGQIVESKFLATIRTDVPVEADIDNLRRAEPDMEALREIFTELEFKTLLRRLSARYGKGGDTEAPAPTPTATASSRPAEGSIGSLFDLPDETPDADGEDGNEMQITDYKVDVRRVSADADVDEVFRRVMQRRRVAIAVAATGADAMTAHCDGIAIADSDGDTVYMPVTDNVRLRLAELLNSDITVLSHSVKRDMLILRRMGIAWTAPYADTAVIHYLLQPEGRHRLSDMALHILHVTTRIFPGEDTSHKIGMALDDSTRAAVYGESAALTMQLYAPMMAEIEREGLSGLLDTLELPLVRVLADMEWEGARIDVAELRRLSDELSARASEMEEEIYRLAGTRFNIGSPMQVGEVLFERLRLDPKAKRTKRGAYSTTEEILEKLRPLHPVVDLILKVRALRKLLATYVEALPRLINPETGHIHSTFNQTVTATGRLSSTNPNLQNIPIRTDDGSKIRRAFIPDDGCLMMSADYSQIELRLMANMSGDPDMIQAFNSGADIHRATAAKIYHETLEDVTDTQRRNAKTANFGIIYGISAFGLSERLGIPRAEAKMLIDGYFASYPHIRDYIAESIETARRQGYVTTVMGRRRYLPDINSRNATVRGYAERNAVNAPLQGSAADIIKRAMIEIHRHIREEGLRSRMILQVHDELVFNVYPDEEARLRDIVVRDMQGAFDGTVPLTVSCGTGTDWLAAH